MTIQFIITLVYLQNNIQTPHKQNFKQVLQIVPFYCHPKLGSLLKMHLHCVKTHFKGDITLRFSMICQIFHTNNFWKNKYTKNVVYSGN